MSAEILIGDMRERLKELPDRSIDSVVCDPPYHLTSIVKRFGAPGAASPKAGKTGAYARVSKGFMGQTWDGGDVAFQPETWAEVLRVLKPGGYIVAFASSRGFGRMSVAIEDAGFITHPMLAWIFGQGWPKATRVKADGYEGWRYGLQALKPAMEPIYLGQKPFEKGLSGTQNIVKWGTGALCIDGCRIEVETPTGWPGAAAGGRTWNDDTCGLAKSGEPHPVDGRWPANVITDGSDEVLAAFPDSNLPRTPRAGTGKGGIWSTADGTGPAGADYGDSGSAARFFYAAKATTEERGEGNNHPTVKPVALMRWLCRLVTPVGGTVLDPFAGSGSTLIAADAEQFNAIGCELSPEYAAIAERRVRDAAGMFAEVRAA